MRAVSHADAGVRMRTHARNRGTGAHTVYSPMEQRYKKSSPSKRKQSHVRAASSSDIALQKSVSHLPVYSQCPECAESPLR